MKRIKTSIDVGFIKLISFIFFVLILHDLAVSQINNLNYQATVLGGYTVNEFVPFWMRSNKYGSIPQDNASFTVIGGVQKEFKAKNNSLVEWGASMEARVDFGKNSYATLIEAYGKMRIGIMEFRVGRSKDIMGLCDTSLSSGSFAISGNALGIPMVQLCIRDFYVLPFLGELFAIKGNFAHGWIGEVPMNLNDSLYGVNTYFHQKSFYGRFGKPEWKWKIYGGFNHQAFWGNEWNYYGEYFTLSPTMTFLYVITGRPYAAKDIPRSKIGNQLGSIDLGVEFEIQHIRVLLYRQNIYDVGALYYLANILDGLNGISLVNMKNNNSFFQWRKLVLEFFYTKNQAGESGSPVVPSGDENYYNNYQYITGWSYKGMGLGNPFICNANSVRDNLPQDPSDYFMNNRVALFHIGFEGSITASWNFLIKGSWSLNYGTFGTDEIGHSTGSNRVPPEYGIFPETTQFSGYLAVNKQLRNGYQVGFEGAFDSGNLYYNSFGFLLSFAKLF